MNDRPCLRATHGQGVSVAGAPHEVRFRIHPSFEASLRARGLDAAERLLEFDGGASLNKSGLAPWRERWRLELSSVGQEPPVTFYLKRYLCPPAGAVRAARRTCRSARTLAAVEWTWMQRLAEDGIGAPVAVALAEELAGGREARSALLCSEVPGVSLERWFAEQVGDPDDLRRRLIGPLADLIARLHRHGYVHRDLYAAHVFLEDDGATPVFRLIDLQRVFQPRWRRRRWRIKDLASLHYSCPSTQVSHTARLRWLKRYLGVNRLRPGDKRLIRAIVRKARGIARHDARRRKA